MDAADTEVSQDLVIPGTAPSRFSMDLPMHGWIHLRVMAGDEHHDISCSDVYDPFRDLNTLMASVLEGQSGTVEIDEEGISTMIRVDVEPGMFTGRLRVFTPGLFGIPEAVHVDAVVDVPAMVMAWATTLEQVTRDHDPAHWNPTHDIQGPWVPQLPGQGFDWVCSQLVVLGLRQGTAGQDGELDRNDVYGKAVEVRQSAYRNQLKGVGQVA